MTTSEVVIIQDTALVAALNIKKVKYKYLELSEFGNKVNFVYVPDKHNSVLKIKHNFYNDCCKIKDAFGFSLEEHRVRVIMRAYYENEKNKKIIKKDIEPQRKEKTVAKTIGDWRPFKKLLSLTHK